jgi:hypothetical protein
MNKRLAIIAIAVTLTPVAMAGQNQATTRERRREAPQANPPSSVTTNDSSTHYQQGREDEPKGWQKFIAWPEGVTTWAVILTLGAIVWQAIETRRAAQAMRRSTDLQVVGLNQWVEIENWQGGADIWKPDTEPEQPDHLMFEFAIVNPTNYPMILKAVSWKIENQEESVIPNCTLPPKGKHPTIASYDLTAEEMLGYAEGKKTLELEVSGTVEFEDVLGHPQTQPFWVAFHCVFKSGIWITKSYKTAAWVQNQEIQKKKQDNA